MLREPVELLKALAEPTRLRLLHLLHHFGTLCVCDLVEITQLQQYHVSRHLATLRKMGLVVDFRDGTRMNYRLAEEASLVTALLDTLGPSLEQEKIIRSDQTRGRKVVAQRTAETVT